VLTNAIYFKGKWATEFDPELTRPNPFYVTPDQPVEVDMMVMKDFTYPTYATQDVALAELPYRGKDISMILLVPTRLDGLGAVEASLTPENLAAWMDALEPRKQDLYLPRFEVASEFGLNDVLVAMGMPDAFDPQTADFSGMDGERDLSIQAAVHKAFVKVNEEGTEAAAATGIGVGVTSMPPSVRADRPFLFLIHDNVTGSILFLGRVTDPTAG
jgi:serpin B